jgi:tetratricopeptide (TPR) repeat protein
MAARKAEELVRLAPESAEGRLLLAGLLSRSGNVLRAEKIYRELVASKPSARGCLGLARLVARAGKTAEAKGLYSKAIALDKNAEMAYLQLGLLFEAEKDESRAAAVYATGIRNVPGSGSIHNQLAWLYGKHAAQRAKGLALARKAHELAPRNGAILDTLGWICFLNRDYAEARKHLQAAHAKLPRNPHVMYHLGKTLVAQGENAAAADVLRRILLVAPFFEHADDVRAVLKKLSEEKSKDASG